MATQSNRLPQLGGISIERALAFQTSASKVVQAVTAEAVDHAKVSFEQGVAVLEQLASAKTLDKGIEIQAAYAKNAYAALSPAARRSASSMPALPAKVLAAICATSIAAAVISASVSTAPEAASVPTCTAVEATSVPLWTIARLTS